MHKFRSVKVLGFLLLVIIGTVLLVLGKLSSEFVALGLGLYGILVTGNIKAKGYKK